MFTFLFTFRRKAVGRNILPEKGEPSWKANVLLFSATWKQDSQGGRTLRRRGKWETQTSLSPFCFQSPSQPQHSRKTWAERTVWRALKWQGFFLSAPEGCLWSGRYHLKHEDKIPRLPESGSIWPITNHHACKSSSWFRWNSVRCGSRFLSVVAYMSCRNSTRGKQFLGVCLALLLTINGPPYSYLPSLPTFTSVDDSLSLKVFWETCSCIAQRQTFCLDCQNGCRTHIIGVADASDTCRQ